MTRFLMDIDDAIDLILKALQFKGCNVIPTLKSFKVEDLFHIYNSEFGLNYEIAKPRTGEKIHEIMASSEEIRRMIFKNDDNIYLMYPNKDFDSLEFSNNEYSSRDNCLSYDELYNYLELKHYFKL